MIDLMITKKFNFLADTVINVAFINGDLKEDDEELVLTGKRESVHFYNGYSPESLISNKTEFEIKPYHEERLKKNLPKFVLTSYKTDDQDKVEFRFKRAPLTTLTWHTGVITANELSTKLVSNLKASVDNKLI